MTDHNSLSEQSASPTPEADSSNQTYFSLFDIPMSFSPDQATLKNKFYALSRQYHPDRFINDDPAEVAENLRMAARVNDAYKVLRNPDATMAYILKINKVLEEEEKYALPPAFLMEMMDINEAISDYEEMPHNESARLSVMDQLGEHLQEWERAAQSLTSTYDAATPNTPLLLQIKDLFFRKKYLLRIQERIDRFAAQ